MDVIDLLGDPAYRHILLNHLPIVGLAVSLLALLAGVVLRQHAITLLGLVLVALTAGSSLPVARFGDAAYPDIYDILDGHGRAWLDHHVDVAETWLPLLYANAVLAIVALVLGAVKRDLLLPSALLVVLVGAGALVSAGAIGSSGGRVQHPEFRLQDLPDQ